MPRSRLDEKLIRAAARVTDWHASHHGALVDELPAPVPGQGGPAPLPRQRAGQDGHADTAQPPSNPRAMRRG